MNSTSYSIKTDSGLGEILAFRLTTIQQVNRIFCCSLGTPLNILVVVVVLRSRQLWSGRNIFWLAVTLFNLLAVVQSITELFIADLYRRSDGSHQTLCIIYSILLGCPYDLVMSGLTLASWDRYLALARHQFYENYATPRNISLILLVVFVIIPGGQTFPYWTGILPVKCGLRYGWISIALCFQGLLSIACLIVQIRLYVFVRSCDHSSSRTINTTELVTQHTILGNLRSNNETNLRENPTEIVTQRINRLELRAARILSTGILPFCVVALSVCICSEALLICRFRGLNTYWMYNIMLIVRELLVFHLVYIPAVFVAQSREFRAAMRRFCRCIRRSRAATQFC